MPRDIVKTTRDPIGPNPILGLAGREVSYRTPNDPRIGPQPMAEGIDLLGQIVAKATNAERRGRGITFSGTDFEVSVIDSQQVESAMRDAYGALTVYYPVIVGSDTPDARREGALETDLADAVLDGVRRLREGLREPAKTGFSFAARGALKNSFNATDEPISIQQWAEGRIRHGQDPVSAREALRIAEARLAASRTAREHCVRALELLEGTPGNDRIHQAIVQVGAAACLEAGTAADRHPEHLMQAMMAAEKLGATVDNALVRAKLAPGTVDFFDIPGTDIFASIAEEGYRQAAWPTSESGKSGKPVPGEMPVYRADIHGDAHFLAADQRALARNHLLRGGPRAYDRSLATQFDRVAQAAQDAPDLWADLVPGARQGQHKEPSRKEQAPRLACRVAARQSVPLKGNPFHLLDGVTVTVAIREAGYAGDIESRECLAMDMVRDAVAKAHSAILSTYQHTGQLWFSGDDYEAFVHGAPASLEAVQYAYESLAQLYPVIERHPATPGQPRSKATFVAEVEEAAAALREALKAPAEKGFPLSTAPHARLDACSSRADVETWRQNRILSGEPREAVEKAMARVRRALMDSKDAQKFCAQALAELDKGPVDTHRAEIVMSRIGRAAAAEAPNNLAGIPTHLDAALQAAERLVSRFDLQSWRRSFGEAYHLRAIWQRGADLFERIRGDGLAGLAVTGEDQLVHVGYGSESSPADLFLDSKAIVREEMAGRQRSATTRFREIAEAARGFPEPVSKTPPRTPMEGPSLG